LLWPLVMEEPGAAEAWSTHVAPDDHWVALTSQLGHVMRGNVGILAGTCNTSAADVNRPGNGGGKLQAALAGADQAYWGRTRIRYSNKDYEDGRGMRVWRTEKEASGRATWVPPQRGYAHCERRYTAHTVISAELVAAVVTRLALCIQVWVRLKL